MYTEPVLDFSEARKALDLLTAEIDKRNKAAVIAICDPHGELILLARMDGAPFSSIAIAANKAYSAARERKPSAEIGRAARHPESAFDIGYFGDSRFTGWGGGVPVWRDGHVIGAVAVSGLPEAEDMEIAELAARALTERR